MKWLDEYKAKWLRPNIDYTWDDLERMLELDLLLFGVCFAWKQKNKLGEVVHVYRVNPVDVTYQRDKDGSFWYRVRSSASPGGVMLIEEADVVKEEKSVVLPESPKSETWRDRPPLL